MEGKFMWIIALLLLSIGSFAEAQQATKVQRIGYLTSNTSSAELPRFDAFRKGLHDLGHVEGQNIAIEHRHAEGKFDRLPGFAAELVVSRLMCLSRLRRMLFKLPRTLP